VRYDQRGLGLSDWTVADLSLDRAVEDLEAVVDAHGLARFPLVGISYGCAVAIAYAARHPERVSRLVFYGGYARGWDRRGLPELAEKRRAFATLLEHDLSSENPALRRHYATLFVPEGTPEQIDWFGDLIRVSVSPSNARRHVLAYGATDVVPLLGRVRAPTLIVHGKRDSVVPIAEGRMLAAAIPGARVLELDTANHILLEHEPAWGEFVAALRAFLAADR
jgi:pimeloyl-ACP methyl ester carboxylesterase